MKILLLLRHAKSSWKNPGLADINRPLNKRGKRDAPRMGMLLRQQDLVPDIILSSPAVRARRTAQAVSEESGYENDIEIQDEFYPGDPYAFIDTLIALPDQVNTALIIAHNPGLEAFLDVLTGETARMPTSTLAHISLPINSWVEMTNDVEGKLVNFWRVKELDY
jgi:phosphohistidine phosphatase